MEQIQLYQDGEREYTKIEGGTGPLVYPAAHVWIYNILYDLTNHGKDILLAQKLFAGLYLVNLAIVMTCYRKAKVGNLAHMNMLRDGHNKTDASILNRRPHTYFPCSFYPSAFTAYSCYAVSMTALPPFSSGSQSFFSSTDPGSPGVLFIVGVWESKWSCSWRYQWLAS